MRRKRIMIKIAGKELKGELTDENSPKTFRKIIDALPLESTGKKWGEEIYFSVPVDMGEEDSRDSVCRGDLAFWPQGNAFCIFYGKTPLTEKENEIKPASPVNVIGKIERPEEMKEIQDGEKVKVYVRKSPEISPDNL